MALDARLLAAQGFGFPLNAIALAVQGFLTPEPIGPAPAEPARPAIVGSGGPGATLNLSDYLAAARRGRALPPSQVHTPTPRQRARRLRQRAEEVLLLLR